MHVPRFSPEIIRIDITDKKIVHQYAYSGNKTSIFLQVNKNKNCLIYLL